MTDPIQQVFAKAEQEAGLRAALEEATSLLRQAKEQREQDKSLIDSQYQACQQLIDAANKEIRARESAEHKLSCIKQEINRIRAWARTRLAYGLITGVIIGAIGATLGWANFG